MKLRVFTTLRQRVVLLLFSVLVPAIVLVVMNAVYTRNHDRVDVQQEAYRLARLASATYERLAETTEQLFAALDSIPSVTGADASSCRAALIRILKTARRFQNLGVVGSDGSVLCSASELTAHVAPQRAWLGQALMSNALILGTVETTPLSPAPTVILAHSAPRRDRILFAAVDLQWLSELAATVPLTPQSSLNVIDDTGTVVARHPNHSSWVGKNVRDTRVMAMVLEQRDGVVEGRGIDGVQRLYGFHRVPMPDGSGFTIAVGIPVDVAYGSANARLTASLAVLLAVAVITLIMARQASERLFTRKIDSLLRAARRLSAGDLSARTEYRWSDDELGELARTFDSMAWAVSQRTEDLRQMMESLRALAARLESMR